MVKQYPHTVTFSSGTAAVQGADGNWTEGVTKSFDVSGRFEPVNGSVGSEYVIGQDGQQIRIRGIVYMPLDKSADIEVGCGIIVQSDSDLILDDVVKQFSRGQLNMRVWV